MPQCIVYYVGIDVMGKGGCTLKNIRVSWNILFHHNYYVVKVYNNQDDSIKGKYSFSKKVLTFLKIQFFLHN